MDNLHIKIPSLIDNIRIVESFIDNVKERYHISDDVYGNIMVAVTESVSNAIIHGNKGNKDKNVSITLLISENALTFQILDEGTGFDYDNLPDPTAPENIGNAGGRGVFLMKNLADDVQFANEGRMVQLTFAI